MDGNASIWKDKTPGAGGHRGGSTSFAAIGATLVPTIVTAVAFLTGFIILRKPYRNIYSPRTYFGIIPEKDRTPSSADTRFSWYHDFRSLSDKFILRHSSLDAYLFLRFLRIIVLVSFLGCCLTWTVLIPINVHGGGKASQLDRISFSNIANPKLLYAHAIIAWVFLGLVMLVITRERLFAIGIRQAHSSLKSNAQRLSSRIVLFLSVPYDALKEDNLHRYFGEDAKRSWPVQTNSDLEALVTKRTSKVDALESAEVQLEINFNKNKAKGDQSQPNGQSTLDSIRQKSRPKTRTHYGIGEKEDSIEKLRKEISSIATQIQEKRKSTTTRHSSYGNAIFVEYDNPSSAYQACQQVHHHSPLALQPRLIGVQPKEVLWSNLTIDPSLRLTYSYMATAFVTATIILWSIPIGIVGTLSNITYLANKVKFLNFINDLPPVILGLLTGFLPPFLLSYFVSYVPFFFRYVAKLSGQPTTVEAEKLTQTWYFAFQLIQVFLVTTFSSGAATVATQIANQPTAVPILLAQNLPKASNFYLSYFILQGIATSAKNVINYSDLFQYLFYDRLFDTTPRQKYNRYTRMKGIGWGSVYPKFANLAVIAIAYSCIAPLVLGFATVGLFFFYLSYRYNLLYVIQVKLEHKAACYMRALQHLMAGVYLSELCLIGLFSIKKATGPSVMVVMLFIVTVIYHFTVNRYLSPLEQFMPLDILEGQDEEQPLLSEQSEGDNRSGNMVLNKLSSILLDPLAIFLEPHFFASHQSLRPWLQADVGEDDDIPTYTSDEIEKAYLNPAMISNTPKLWIPKDPNGLSKTEIEDNDAAGLACTDEGAELGPANVLHWDKDDFSKTPVFKQATKY